MSLYSDLNEVLTPYANKIKELGTSDDQIKADLEELQDGGYVADQQKIQEKIDNWLDEHPEATTTVQDGSVTEPKIADSAVTEEKLSTDVTAKITGVRWLQNAQWKKRLIYHAVDGAIALTGSSTCIYMQGGCYDSANARFVMAFVNSDDSQAILVAVEPADLSTAVLVSSEQAIGHCNDMTYCDYDGNIYLTNYTSSTTSGTLAVVDPSTLEVSDTLSLDTDGAVRYVSYDSDNQIFYVGTYTTIYIYDTSWTLQSSCAWSTDDWAGETTYHRQSTFVYDGKFVLISYSEGSDVGISGIYYSTYNMKTGAVESASAYMPTDQVNEVEFVAVIGNAGYEFGRYNENLYASKIWLSKTAKTEPISYSYFDHGNLIYPNGDLDDYIGYGTYYCRSSAVSSTLSNVPLTTAGFSMRVYAQGNSYIGQEVIYNTSFRTFRRKYDVGTDTWGDWCENVQVVTSGTSNGWYYEIYSNKTAKAFISKTLDTISTWSTEGNIYYSPMQTLTLPDVGTISTYSAFGTANKMCYIASTTISGTNFRFYVVGPYNSEIAVTVRLHIDFVLG